MREYRADGSVESEGNNRAGKAEGVARLYGPDETETGVVVFVQGEVKSMRMTVAGLQAIVDEVNSGYVEAQASQRLTVIDETTVQLSVEVDDESKMSSAEKSRFRQVLRKDPSVCAIFPLLGIDVLVLDAHTPKGAELDKFTMIAADCEASQHPK